MLWAIHPQFLKVIVKHWHIAVWASNSFFFFFFSWGGGGGGGGGGDKLIESLTTRNTIKLHHFVKMHKKGLTTTIHSGCVKRALL